MSKITIFASMTVDDQHADKVRDAVLELIPPTLAEAGCLEYRFHQSNDRPGQFFFYENWASMDALREHRQTEHLKRYLNKVNGLIAGQDSQVVTELS